MFDDQDDDTKGVQNEATTREVAENTNAVAADDVAAARLRPQTIWPTTVGAVDCGHADPDPNEDALVYTLEGVDAISVRYRTRTTVDRLKWASGTELDYETEGHLHASRSRADRLLWRLATPSTVTITVTDK